MNQRQIKAALIREVCAYQRRLKPVCQRCGAESALDLHHILTRRHVHFDLEQLPLPFHILLCRDCHQAIDNYDARNELLARNIAVFGIEAMERAFEQWGAIAPNGPDTQLMSLEGAKKIWQTVLAPTSHHE